ncbi:hypothetical protein EMPS_07118 [Entomortierella parvispora]|uniref:Uncharacterized protein n=1 Tax=Entomortierella parvispora TaxID=205924 RepID=A0A9P3HDJ6_9FUNG|nr:hypothetical protein EMPS_07118 [Entomortierella parvispora]
MAVAQPLPHARRKQPRTEIKMAPPPASFRESLKEISIGLFVFCIFINIIIFTQTGNQLVGPAPPSSQVYRRPYNFSSSYSSTGRGQGRPALRHRRQPPAPLPAWQLAWIARQEINPDDFKDRTQPTMDLIYTWVNGTEPGLRAMKESYKSKSPLFKLVPRAINAGLPGRKRGPEPIDPRITSKGDETANRFRDLDELRYSMRSVGENAGQLFRKIHLLTTEVVEDREDGSKARYGQAPIWMKQKTNGATTDDEEIDDRLELVPHKYIFDDPEVLPTFNSLAIESQMHHVPDLADIFVYLNDDVFFGKPLGPGDFWTPQYGFVFHFNTFSPVAPTEPNLLKPGETVIGEAQSLRHSNYLLSQHFGSRHRAYVEHIPHILSGPILDEMQSIWPEEFKKTSSHRFRGEGEAREIQVSFMMAHYVLERHRETLLSSYWRYRLDKNRDGRLDWSERASLIQIVDRYRATQEQVSSSKRVSYSSEFVSALEDIEKVFEQVGIPFSQESKYQLSGRDGYPFMIMKSDLSRASNDQRLYRPYHPSTSPARRFCEFNFDFCLGPDFTNSTIEYIDAPTITKKSKDGSTSTLFERLAFTEFHCGDCLLHILRQESENPGLGDLMPEDQESKEFKEVAQDIAKYSHVVANSEFQFVMMTDGLQSQRVLDGMMRRRNTITYLCTNDDLPDSNLIVQRVKDIYHNFMDARFPTLSPWEKST